MRGAFLLFSIVHIVLAQGGSDNFRWDVWRTQRPKLDIEQTQLPAEDSAAVKAAVIEILKRGGIGPTLSNLELQQLASSTRVKLMDVTGDRVPEVIAEGGFGNNVLCSPTGNCPWWVLTKIGTGYKPILESFGNGLGTDCRRVKRQCDIVVFMHGSATELAIKLYRLSNRHYRKVAEYDAIWPEDENGRIAQNPTVKRVR